MITRSLRVGKRVEGSRGWGGGVCCDNQKFEGWQEGGREWGVGEVGDLY